MMRRLIKRVGLIVLIGVILNVAVAWVSAVFVSTAQQTTLVGWRDTMKTETGFGWEVYRYETWSAARMIAFGRENSMLPAVQPDDGIYPFGSCWPSKLDATAAGTKDDKSGQRRLQAQMLEVRGWPLFSMQAHWHDADSTVDHTKRWHWGISLSARPTRSPGGGLILNDLRVLPLLPIWPGFILNTLFYSAIIWAIFVVPFQFRRMIRRRRNQCPSCGYPRGASNICSECGAALSMQTSS